MDTTFLTGPRVGINGLKRVRPYLKIAVLLVMTSVSLLMLRNQTVQLVKNPVSFPLVINKVNTQSWGRSTYTRMEVQTSPENGGSTSHVAEMIHLSAARTTATPKGHLETGAPIDLNSFPETTPKKLEKVSLENNSACGKSTQKTCIEGIPQSMRILHTEEDIQVETQKKCLADVQKRIYNIFTPFLKRSSSVILVDPAYHQNVGDNLLSYGEFCLLNDLKVQHTECGVVQSQGFNKPCRKGPIAKPTSMAMYHAGGNWGDVWPSIMPGRFHVLNMYRATQVSVIGMPQSLFYTSQINENRDTEQLNSMVERGLNITLTWRQKDSYDKASKLYPNVRNILSPDIAFMIGPISHSDEYRNDNYTTVDILFLLREDRETRVSSTDKKVTIPRLLQARNLTFRIVDWKARFQAYNQSSKKPPMRQLLNPGVFHYNEAIGSAVALFSSGRVIVTDRLHGSIFALLMNKPHIFIDQFYKKIRMTREASLSLSEACQKKEILKYDEATNVTDAIGKAIEFLQKKPN